jgi:gliding-associated putative ABC transporter substrate-binding component GldG
MKKSTLFVQLAIVIVILVVLNLISESLYFRLDFTEDRRYTLSDATKNVLEDLDDVITVKAFFTKDLPPQLAYVRNDLQDQLIEYEDRSGGNIVFEFINPNESEQLKQEAMQNGIAPISINVVENDQRQQLQAFMGVVFKAGDRTEVIPLVQPGAAMEYDLTTSIKKLSIQDKPKVGVIQGYGEASLASIPQLNQQLSVLYDVENFSIRDTSTIPAYYRSLIWISPADSVNPSDFAKLDQYLNNGGKLFLAYAPVKGDLQTSMLSSGPNIGIRSWVGQKGLTMADQFVIDAQCAAVTVQQRQGFFTINSQVEFPYFPQVTNFAEHPMTSGIEAIVFPFVSPLIVNNQDTTLKVTPLVYSSDVSGTQSPPVYIDIQKRWNERDFVQPEQILAAAVEGIGNGGKMVVVTNGTFVVNGEGQQQQQLSPDNVNLASNAIDWLSDDTGLIDLRTKGVTNRPLESIEDSTKNLLKYGNVFAPILIILIYAGIRRSNMSRKRQRWTQGNYA